MDSRDIVTFIPLIHRMEMYTLNHNRETIIAFMNGLDMGMKPRTTESWTKLLSSYLLEKYNIMKPSTGWPYQVKVYSKKMNLSWEIGFKQIFLEIFENAYKIELSESHKELNRMFIEHNKQ